MMICVRDLHPNPGSLRSSPSRQLTHHQGREFIHAVSRTCIYNSPIIRSSVGCHPKFEYCMHKNASEYGFACAASICLCIRTSACASHAHPPLQFTRCTTPLGNLWRSYFSLHAGSIIGGTRPGSRATMRLIETPQLLLQLT